MSKILVTGGAGYIGTNVVSVLLERGEKVVVVDDFSNSKEKYIMKLAKLYPSQLELLSFNFGDKEKLDEAFKKYGIDSVIHLAGKKYVQESNENPELYNLVNVEYTKILLEVMKANGVKNIVFASTAMVYGNADPCPIGEKMSLNPLSCYADTKKRGEELIVSFAKQQGASAVILRLSNPIGANEKLMLGDDNLANAKPLLPHLLDAAKKGERIVLNGNDYNTKDGTPVRDFVHVCDVAEAFALAVSRKNKGVEIFNVGSGGEGQSVLEVLHEVEEITGKKLEHSFGKRRAGDVETFVSDNSKARESLGVKFSRGLREMVSSQFEFSNHIAEERKESKKSK